MQEKVLMYVPTLEGGGAEKVFVILANFFVHNGLEVIYLSAYGNSYKHLLDEKVNVKQLRRNKPFNSKKINLGFRFGLMPFYLATLILIDKPTYLISTVHEANLLAYNVHKLVGRNVKFVLRMANIYEDTTIPTFLQSFLRSAVINTPHLIANSPDTAASYRSFTGLETLSIDIIGNPAYKQTNLVDENKTADPYLISVGRLESQKNHQLLLESFKIVSQNNDSINLMILGEGSLKEELITQIESLNLKDRVILKGFVENPSELYQNAEAFVLSSNFEGFGNVIVEAMAHGLPVISTDCPGGPNFILDKDEYGVLCNPNNAQALANGINEVLYNSENYPSEAIVKRAKDFSVEKIGLEYLNSIREN